MRHDVGRALEVHSGGEPVQWHVRSRRSDLPGPHMRAFWLLYTLFVFISPAAGDGERWEWTLAAASVAVFLPLYFAYWTTIERRQRLAFAAVVGIAVLGFVLTPFTSGATTYVIYAAAMVPFVASTRQALAFIATLVIGVAMVSLAYAPPGRYWLAGMTTILLVLVAVGNLFYADWIRRNAQLWRAKEDVEEMAAVAERERISRDLHDLLGHTLSVIALKSELASKLARVDPAKAAEEIREVERVSRSALSEVRAAVEGFRGRGFTGELRNAARALEAAGVRLDAEGGDMQMPPRQEGILALALREAVTNVIRHARASTCRVSLRADGARCVLTVTDDGVGGPVSEGNGLAGMRERAAALGGTVTVDDSHGIRVTVALPLTSANPAAETA
jgi:two-component system sensor histidine kinase DesK